jgi:hypothetical protein
MQNTDVEARKTGLCPDAAALLRNVAGLMPPPLVSLEQLPHRPHLAALDVVACGPDIGELLDDSPAGG